MLTYILEVSLCWGAFYLLYWLLLSRETFFHFNRWYLLGTLLASLVIPAVEWEFWAAQTEMATVYLQPITIGVQTLEVTVTATALTSKIGFLDVLTWMYWAGMAFFMGQFLVGLSQIYRLYRRSEKHFQNNYELVLSEKAHAPFSFFNCLFLSKNIELDPDDRAQILRHELAHIRGGHSVDILLLEILNAIFWCSPFIYLYRRSLRNVHEYIADAAVLRTTQRKQYGHLLIRQSQSGPAIAIANHFHSPLKKRILMMMQPKSSRRHLTKYLLALPLLALLVMAFAQKNNWTSEFPTALTSILGGDYDETKIRQELHKAMTENVDSTYVNSEGGITFMRTGLQMERCHEIYLHLINEHPDREADIQKLVKEVAAANGIKFIVKEDGKICYEVDENFRSTQTRLDTIPPFGNAPLVQLNPREVVFKDFALEVYHPDGRVEKLPAGTDMNKYMASLENVSRVDVSFIEEEKLVKMWLKGSEVDEPALYPGCDGEKEAAKRKECSDNYLMLYVAKNIKYPKAAREQGIEGQVFVKFQISESGKVHSPKIVKSVGSGCDEEVLRIVNEMPSWTPARKNGKPVASEFVLPVKFLLDPSDLKADPKKDTLVIMDPTTFEEQTKVFDEKGVVVVGKSDGMVSSRKNEVFMVVEEMPEFPGGVPKLFEFIGKNMKYPKAAREAGVEGRVIIQFIVGKDSTIREAKVVKGVSDEMDAEALRVIKLMPKWIPGKQSGKAVDVQFVLPIQFKLGNDNAASAKNLPKTEIPKNTLQLQDFKASPNPSNGILNLSFKGDKQPTVVKIFDLQGKELYGLNVLDFSGSFYQQIDLSKATKGTLIISIIQGDKAYSEKIIVQ